MLTNKILVPHEIDALTSVSLLDKYKMTLIYLLEENDDVFIYPNLFIRAANLLQYGADYEDFDLISTVKFYVFLRKFFRDRYISQANKQFVGFVLYHNNIYVCPKQLKGIKQYLLNCYYLIADRETFEHIKELNETRKNVPLITKKLEKFINNLVKINDIYKYWGINYGS